MTDIVTMEDIAAEAAVLGSLILEPALLLTVRDRAKWEYFSTPANQIIYKAILVLWDSGNKNSDIVNLRGHLTQNGLLAEVGGVDYLVQLAESVPSAANCEFYLDRMIEVYRQRELLRYGHAVISAAGEPGDIEAKYTKAEKSLQALRSNEIVTTDQIDIEDSINSVNFRSNDIFLSTGYPQIDSVIYGLGKADMITIAGRPGMGKSSLLASMALKHIQGGRSAAFFSLEMSKEQLQQRLLCMVAEINLKDALTNRLNEGQHAAIDTAKEELSTCGLTLDSTAGLTPERLRTKVLRLQARRHITAVFVDYLGLMRTSGKRQTRYESTSEISNSIKALAIETGIPIIIACQLNRATENRDNKRPRLSDLRDSGSIEQDSDIVMLLYRQDYYSTIKTGETELIIAKNRRGQSLTVNLQFIDEQTRFE